MTEDEKPKARHKFAPGNRGNPLGRPPKVTRMDELIATAVPAVLEKTIAAALAGDMSAASIVLGMAGRKINR